MYSKAKTYLILFGGVFALSTSAIFVKMANAPSAVVAFYRLLLAALILLPFLLLSKIHRAEAKALRSRQWLQIFSAGFLLALHYVLWFESLGYTSIASSTVLVCLQPLFSLALERFVLKKRIKSTAMIGCIIAMVGCVMIGYGDFQISGKNLLGDILALIAAGVIALYYLVGEKVRKDVSAVTYSTLGYSSSAVVLLIYALLRGDSLIGYPTSTWLALAALAVISTIGGQFIFNLLLKKVPASAVTMSILGEPIGTCLLAYLIFHEGVAMQQFVGMMIILVGMVIYFLPEKKKA